MIVPMKKVSLIISGDKKDETLKTLRKLGIIHIEIAEGSGERLVELREQIALLESAVFTIGKKKNTEQKDVSATEALSVANEIKSLDEEKKQCQAERVALSSELDRLKIWGDIDPDSIGDLEAKGIKVSFYEMPRPEYEALPDSLKTVKLDANKSAVKFLLYESDSDIEDERKLFYVAVTRAERNLFLSYTLESQSVSEFVSNAAESAALQMDRRDLQYQPSKESGSTETSKEKVSDEQRQQWEQERAEKAEYWELVKYARAALYNEYFVANHYCKGILLEYSAICKQGPDAILAKAREMGVI